MNFNVTKIVFPWFFLVGFCFPISFEVENNTYPLMGRAWALSSESMPLTSNIFVDIAKQQNPAVVNVSMRAKAHKTSDRFKNPGRPGRGINFVISMINFSDNNGQDQVKVSLPDEEGLDQGLSLMRMDIF